MAEPGGTAGHAGTSWPARMPMLVGLFATVLLVGGIGGWSTGTTLSGAVIASGSLQVESRRQVIQHPDGGVVRDVLVRDGDRVEAGDILLHLDGRRLLSELAIAEGRLRGFSARRARLIAERSGADHVTFSADLLALARTDTEARSVLDGEAALFSARREALQQRGDLLDEQNDQIASRIAGIEAQLAALDRQTELVRGELDNKRSLLDDGLIPAVEVYRLERELAGLEGETGRLRAEISGQRGAITANEIERLRLRTAQREEATSAERELEFTEIELTERRIDLIDRLSRMDLRAPVSGIVYESTVFAAQTVVQPAQPVMYIVPQDQPLIVSARVDAIDVADVHVGQDVALRFVAFDQNSRSPAEGTVVRVSADAITDPSTGASYFAVDIRPSEDAIGELRAGEELVPGMPVEAYIRTGDRTVLAYLAQPFTAFFDRALRE
ncbi:MAG: HlyD family type I secretion periplasmic adaptor subunit [Pseudomonadota bacterium]